MMLFKTYATCFSPSHKVLSSEMIHLGFLFLILCLYSTVFVLIHGVVFVLVFNNVWTFACWCCECHDLFSILILFVVDLFFHLSRFLFNFESSCVWLFTQLPPPKAMYTLLSVSDPCLYFLPGCFFILSSHWFLCSPDYLVLTWFSYFAVIIASAILVSKFFYW